MECSYLQRFNVTSVFYFIDTPDYFNMSSTNTEGEDNISVFTALDDETRVVPAIEFRNVKFAYDDQIILDDISFRVMRGELLVVLSASGGGKSTILKLTLGSNRSCGPVIT